MDICFELYQGMFSQVKALQGATVSCMRTMGRKFRTLHLQVGHHILKQGDQVDYLFVIGRGAVEVIKDGELVTLLGNIHTSHTWFVFPKLSLINYERRYTSSIREIVFNWECFWLDIG